MGDVRNAPDVVPRIIEERVYMDTGSMRAARSGQALEPVFRI